MANSVITTETSIEKSLVKKTKAAGGWALKLLAAWEAGIPDRLCLFPGGRLVFVELKRPGKRPRKLQAAVHERLRGMGFPVETIDSFDKIDKVIDRYGGFK